MDLAAVYIDALECGVAGWRQIWGDPLLSGTIFVASYVVAAAFIFRVAPQATGRERWLWRLCGFFFLFQALNTPLDLHAFPGAFGRCLAHAQGWYDNRQQIQVAFLIGLAIGAALLFLLTLAVFYRNMLNNLLLVSGVVITLGITLIKGINYHGTEVILGGGSGPFRWADLIEYSGIAIALLAALKRMLGKNR